MKRITNIKYVALSNWFLKSLQLSSKTWIVVDMETIMRNLPKALLHDRNIKCPKMDQLPVFLMHLTDALANLEKPLIVSEYPTDTGFEEIERIPYVITYAPIPEDCILMPDYAIAITEEVLATEPPQPVKRSK